MTTSKHRFIELIQLRQQAKAKLAHKRTKQHTQTPPTIETLELTPDQQKAIKDVFEDKVTITEPTEPDAQNI